MTLEYLVQSDYRPLIKRFGSRFLARILLESPFKSVFFSLIPESLVPSNTRQVSTEDLEK